VYSNVGKSKGFWEEGIRKGLGFGKEVQKKGKRG